MAQVTERTIPKVDDNYPGFCCAGFDYTIRLIFLAPPDDPIDYTSIYGRCENQECPVHHLEPIEEDMYRGVSHYLLDDFEDALEEKGVKVAEC
jgi:hypothetical protein